MARNLLALLGWILLCWIPAIIGASFPPGSYYASLNKPDWTPPSWLFGPVWSLLYTAMAVAAWLVWKKGGWKTQKTALTLFLVQLALNALWSPLFFGLQNPKLAFFEIILLWIAIAITLTLFSRSSRVAAALLVPYLAWVSFASALNASLWLRNPPILH